MKKVYSLEALLLCYFYYCFYECLFVGLYMSFYLSAIRLGVIVV